MSESVKAEGDAEVEHVLLLSEAASSEAPSEPAPPAWYTPKRLLLLFCSMQLLVYMDRGIIASTGVKGQRAANGVPGTGLTGHFDLDELAGGFLYSAFMVGLLVGSPLMAEASKYFNPFRVIAVGLTCWVVATTGCAAAPTYGFLLFCRCVVGLGEASFCSLAAPFVDDAAPPGQKTRWLACFFLFIPVGVAFGFVLGKVVGDALGWRAPFLVVSWAMIPFIFVCALSKPMRLRGSVQQRLDVGGEAGAEAGSDDGKATPRWRVLLSSFLADVRAMTAVPMFNITCVAWACHTALVGCLSYNGPIAAKAIFRLDSADIVFGGLTVVTGVAGSLTGAYVLDRASASVPYALRFCAGVTLAAFILTTLTFQTTSLGLFIPTFAAAELAIFSINAVVSAAILWSVPLRLRSLSMSATTIAIHVMGDVPSPPIMGALQDWLNKGNKENPNNWRLSFAVIACYLLVAAILFAVASRIAQRTAKATRTDESRAADLESEQAAGGDSGLLGAH